METIWTLFLHMEKFPHCWNLHCKYMHLFKWLEMGCLPQSSISPSVVVLHYMMWITGHMKFVALATLTCSLRLTSHTITYGRTTHSQPLKQFCICSRVVEGNVNLQPCRKIEMMDIAKFLWFFSFNRIYYEFWKPKVGLNPYTRDRVFLFRPFHNYFPAHCFLLSCSLNQNMCHDFIVPTLQNWKITFQTLVGIFSSLSWG